MPPNQCVWLYAEFNLSCRKKCLFKDLLSYLLYVDDFHHLQIYLQTKTARFQFLQINGRVDSEFGQIWVWWQRNGRRRAEYSTFLGGHLSKIIKTCPLFYMTRQSRTTADKAEDEIVRPGFSSARYILWGNIYIFWHILDLDVLYSTNGWGGNKHKCYRHIFVTDGQGEEGGAGINKNIFSKRYRHIFVTDL